MTPADWLLAEASTPQNLQLAFDLLVQERTKNESYCDWTEIEAALANREGLIAEVQELLANPDSFEPDSAFLYSFPKDRWVSRRMIYRSFRDALLKFALILPIAERVEPKMSATSFTNRRAPGALAQRWLLAPYMSHSVRNWRNWKEGQEKTASCVLETDISTFYDSIAHEHVMAAVCQQAGLDRASAAASILGRSLRCQLRYLKHEDGGWTEDSQEVHQGLSTGCAADAILANILLMDLDEIASRHPTVAYGRYADDIVVFGPSQQVLVAFMRDATQLLASLSLNLSKGKTCLECGPEHVTRVATSRDTSMSDVGESELEYEADEEDAPTTALEYGAREAFTDPLDIDAIVLKRARDFCKFMSHGKVHGERPLPLESRKPIHMGALARILEEATFAAKHASWLIIESFTSKRTTAETKAAAKAIIVRAIESPATHPYVKQRLLHHLLRPRGSAKHPGVRWLYKYLNDSDFQDLQGLPDRLGESDDLAVRNAANTLRQALLAWPSMEKVGAQ